MSRCCLLLLVAGAAACRDPMPEPPAPVTTTAPAVADTAAREPEPDTVFTAFEREVWQQLEQDAAMTEQEARALVLRLQPIADSAMDEPTAAPALLRLGWLKLRIHDDEVSAEALAARPHDFAWFEIQGRNYYLATDLDSLLSRFPGSSLRDDAAYALTYRPRGGECEGYIECYVQRGTDPLLDFMAAYPTSRHVTAAVARANAHIAAMLSEQPDLRTATERYDPVAVRTQLLRYDSIARTLPRDARNAADATLEPLRRRFDGEPPAAADPRPHPLTRELGLFYDTGSGLCIMMEDPRLQIGTPVLLVDVRAPDTVSAVITLPLRHNCAGRSTFPPPRLAAYSVVPARAGMELSHGLAITSYQPDVRMEGGRLTARIGGEEQVLSECTSSEGLHHFVRKASSNEVLWHVYVSLGYDTEPTCPEPAGRP